MVNRAHKWDEDLLQTEFRAITMQPDSLSRPQRCAQLGPTLGKPSIMYQY
jgi:hypothetical protein